MPTIKKIILFALTVLMMTGCTKKDSNGHIAINTGNVNNPEIVIIDSCEYVTWNYRMAHKGNCRFCRKRDSIKWESIKNK